MNDNINMDCTSMDLLINSSNFQNRTKTTPFFFNENKMNCELMLTYDTPALRQIGSRNLTGPKTLPTIWYTYMTLVTKYQISAINSYWEKWTDRGKTVYPAPPFGEQGYNKKKYQSCFLKYVYIWTLSWFNIVSWRKQVTFWWDDNDVRFVLDQHVQ